MLNFTVGPVQSYQCVKEIGAQDVPYFRTAEFSAIMLENEQLIQEFADAPHGGRVAFLTGSGTASMEASIMNLLTHKDRALIVNGGAFGHRFTELCQVHHIDFDEIKLNVGEALTAEHLTKINGNQYSTFIVNVHETSTGVHYDLQLMSDFCRKYRLFFIVDAISSFLADEISMCKYGIDAMIAGSQKAFGCPPGISLIVLSPRAQERVWASSVLCYYLDLKSVLRNGERGQTPFTPAVGTLLQMNARLRQIKSSGGVNSSINWVKELAEDFRKRIQGLPLEITSTSLSNAVTPLHPLHVSANEVFLKLKDEYGIWVCPNGGELKDTIFRVGHIGNLSIENNKELVSALADLANKGLL